MSEQDYFDPEETVGFLLWDANRAIARTFAERIAQHGISMGLWPFLRALWDHDGLTQRELSERVRMKGPTTVAALNKLEDKGLVRRKANRADARKINVYLTPGGRRIYRQVMPDVEAVNRQMMASFSPDEQDTFKDLIKRVRNNATVA